MRRAKVLMALSADDRRNMLFWIASERPEVFDEALARVPRERRPHAVIQGEVIESYCHPRHPRHPASPGACQDRATQRASAPPGAPGPRQGGGAL